MEDETYRLVMPFFDESPSFVHGFECGKMWQLFDGNEIFDAFLFHTENTKQVELMCKRFHYEYEIKEVSEGWNTLTAKLDLSKAN